MPAFSLPPINLGVFQPEDILLPLLLTPKNSAKIVQIPAIKRQSSQNYHDIFLKIDNKKGFLKYM